MKKYAIGIALPVCAVCKAPPNRMQFASHVDSTIMPVSPAGNQLFRADTVTVSLCLSRAWVACESVLFMIDSYAIE